VHPLQAYWIASCSSIRFRGSSFKAIGNQNKIEGKWAIVGGTGVFTFAQGTISIYRIQDNEASNIKEIRINAFCYTPPQATATETKVKITFLSAYFLRPFFPDKTFFVLN
jgi:hypothetical protein